MSCFINLIKNDFKKNRSILNIYDIFKNNSIKKNDLIYRNFIGNDIIINENGYFKTIIEKNNDFELVLITWDSASYTNYHNHPKNGCVMKILDGVLIENNKKLLPKNSVHIKYHNEYHKIFCPFFCQSLHFYTPPKYYN